MQLSGRNQLLFWQQLSVILQQLSVILLLSSPLSGSASQPVRTTLAQHQACYYQPFHKHLACQCGQDEVAFTYLGIKMEYWVREMGQEVTII